jgi:GAF domain-containing protein
MASRAKSRASRGKVGAKKKPAKPAKPKKVTVGRRAGSGKRPGKAVSAGRELRMALAEALEQQAATSEILRVISRSKTDVQPVFDAIADSARTLCRATSANVFTYDGEMIRVATMTKLHPAYTETMHQLYPRRPGRETGVARAIMTRRVVVIPDVVADRDYSAALGSQAIAGGFRSVLAVPLMREGKAIGAIAVGRPESGAFPRRQVALLETFADQAVVAIENVRLFTEAKAALERQKATSEVLAAISGAHTDASPVFETIARNAHRLSGALRCNVLRYDGNLLHIAACHGFSPEDEQELRKRYPVEPGDASVMSGRVILSGKVELIDDALRDPLYDHEHASTLTLRRMLGVPMLREGTVLGVIVLAWRESGHTPAPLVDLLRTFADQAVIAIENVRLFTELESRNRDLTEALEQQTATSEILRVISRSPTDVQPVFDTIAAAALKLCSANSSNVLTFDGDLLRIAALVTATPEGAHAVRGIYPRVANNGHAAGRAILRRELVVIPDILEDSEFEITETALTGGFRSILAVPLMRNRAPIGAIVIGRAQAGPFPGKQIELLRTFADQAVIAIENVRLFDETREALDQQRAAGEVLTAISSSIADTKPVFDVILQSCQRLFEGNIVGVMLVRDDNMLDLGSYTGQGSDELRRLFPLPLTPETASGRAVLEQRMVSTPDTEAADASELLCRLGRICGYRSITAAPMIFEGRGIGALWIARPFVGLLSEKQLTLLRTFADQAVIAIQNARLFKELQVRNRDLTEALEQQTATSEILRVISQSPTDVQPVFDTIADAALKLCKASTVGVYTFDGELVRIAATANLDREGAEAFVKLWPRPPARDTASGRAIVSRQIVVIPDVLEEADYSIGAAAAATGFRSVVSVPLMRDGAPIGALGVGRSEPGAFPDTQIALLKTFADQAVIAIENVRLFKELEARTAQLTRSVDELKALGEVGQAVSSTLDLETVLRTIVSRAAQLAGMDGGSIWEYDEEREEFHLHATDRLPDKLVEVLRTTPIKKGEGALGRLALTGEPVEIRDFVDDSSYQSRLREVLIRTGFRSVLAAPLLREGHLLGALAVNRRVPGGFDPQIVELLKTFASQSALAIQNARLFREIEHKSRELEAASRHKSEFLTNMSHELRTPLNAIIGFSEVLSERMFGDINEKQAEYLSDILESGKHLLSLINDILDLSKIEAGRMELEPTDFDLPGAIENTMILVRERADRRGIALGRAVDERLGTIRGDERKVKQVLLNLLSNALKFTPEGGRIDVKAGLRDGVAEVAVTDTGVGIAPEDQQAVFEEFRQVGSSARKIEGTGLGLAISRKFIQLHGGTIRLDSEIGKGSTFTFTLPLNGAEAVRTGA